MAKKNQTKMKLLAILKIGILITVVVISAILVSQYIFYTTTYPAEAKESVLNVIPSPLPGPILWMANHETGNLKQWQIDSTSNPSQDSGYCKRPGKGVSTDQAHTGKYSMKMTIKSWFPDSGCRQFRYPEIRSGESLFYSAWLYFPEKYQIDGWTNVMQFKAKRNSERTKPSELFWSLRAKNRESGNMYFELSWKGGEGKVTGPTSNDGLTTKQFNQQIKDLPEKQWVHVEIYLKQSSDFDGHMIVWQDGVEIYNMPNIRTKFEDGFNSWSANSYGAGIKPSTFTVYVDDAVVSKERIGPEFSNFLPQ